MASKEENKQMCMRDRLTDKENQSVVTSGEREVGKRKSEASKTLSFNEKVVLITKERKNNLQAVFFRQDNSKKKAERRNNKGRIKKLEIFTTVEPIYKCRIWLFTK